MAVRKILRMGHPLLRQKSRPLAPEELNSENIKTLIRDLVDTMRANEGVGIAAPQIGEMLRLAIIEFGEEQSRYPGMGSQGLTVFVNPVLKFLTEEEQGFWEGCLSVPDLRGLVSRPTKVQCDFIDEHGVAKQIIADGFLATVLQHEFDHLDGTLYIDRVRDTKDLAFVEEFRQFIAQAHQNSELAD